MGYCNILHIAIYYYYSILQYGILQNVGTGTTGQVLLSNGSGTLPSWSSSTNISKSVFKYTLKYNAYDASLMDEQNHIHFDSSYYVHLFELNNTVSSPSAQGHIYLPNDFTNGRYFYIRFFGTATYGLQVYTDDYIIVTDSSGTGFNPSHIFTGCTFKVTYWTENNNPWKNIPYKTWQLEQINRISLEPNYQCYLFKTPNAAATFYFYMPPNLTTGKEIILKDIGGNASTFNLNFHGVMGDFFDTTLSDTYVMNTNYESKHYVYDLEESYFYSI